MNQLTDQVIARGMLETRKHDCSLDHYFRRSTKRYLALFAIFVLAFIVFGILRRWDLVYLMFGMLAGCLLRDIGWVRAVRKTWSFTLKVTDWDKVQQLADEKPIS